MPLHRKCCCDEGGLYIGCYCPTKIPVCADGLTLAEIAALDAFPEVMANSLGKICSDSTSGETQKTCRGYSNPAAYISYCLEGDLQCPAAGAIVYTGTQVGTSAQINCNQYLNFATNGLGRCQGTLITDNSDLGSYCSISQAECLSYETDLITTVWTAGTCTEIFTVQEVPETGDTFQELCSEKDCCSEDDCNNPKLCGCITWVITEVGANGNGNNPYQSGNTLGTVPPTWTPSTAYAYTGYMQLRITCKGVTTVKESWTTINGSTHTLGNHAANCIDTNNFAGSPVTYTQYSAQKTSAV